MAELKDPVCSLAERPKTFCNRGMDYIDGKWVAKSITYCTGAVESHVRKVLKTKGRYYV